MTKLETINAEDLQNRTYEPTHFLVDELIPEGLHILAGAPKIGKSWLALWLCLCVAQGQTLWNFTTTQGEVLYLSLEDSFQRIQTRLFDLTEDAPPTLHFAIMADTLKHGLEQQIEQFLVEHPATKLVVIDTLQRVRGTGSDSNLYANDYQDIGLLKKLADKRHIAILPIHHLRKLHDDDPMNMISGSTGLSGAEDSTFVLQKSSRLANIASLHCTGRDIADRTLKRLLRFQRFRLKIFSLNCSVPILHTSAHHRHCLRRSTLMAVSVSRRKRSPGWCGKALRL